MLCFALCSAQDRLPKSSPSLRNFSAWLLYLLPRLLRGCWRDSVESMLFFHFDYSQYRFKRGSVASGSIVASKPILPVVPSEERLGSRLDPFWLDELTYLCLAATGVISATLPWKNLSHRYRYQLRLPVSLTCGRQVQHEWPSCYRQISQELFEQPKKANHSPIR